MDKNKNRTDLLAAGRKKLQQFRQKKDGKGGTSHGKSNKKHSKQEQPEPNAVEDASTPQDIEVDATSERLDPSLTSASNSVLPASDDSVVSEIPSQVEGESTNVGTLEDEISSEGKVIDSEEKPSQPPSARTLAPVSTNEELGETAGSGNIETTEDEESLLSHEYILVGSLSKGYEVNDVGAIQEADALGSGQLDGDGELDHGSDARSPITMLSVSSEPQSSPKSTAGHIVEARYEMVQAEESPQPAILYHGFEEFSHHPPLSLEADQSPPFGHEGRDQEKEDRAGTEYSSHDASSSLNGKDNETYVNGRELEERSRFLESENAASTGLTVSLSQRVDSDSISLSQLIDVVKRLGEDEYNLLLASRDFASSYRSTHRYDGDGAVLAECIHPEVVEQLEEELLLANITKDVLCWQLEENSRLHVEFRSHQQKFLDETSMLNNSLDTAHGKNASLTEELLLLRSEYQAILGRSDDIQNQFHAKTLETEELQKRVCGLQTALEDLRQTFSSQSTELADCKNVLAAVQMENQKLCKDVASVTEERNISEEEKKTISDVNEKLSIDLADRQSTIASLRNQISLLNDDLSSARDDSKKHEAEKEHLACENERQSITLADSKRLLEELQIEKGNLSESIGAALSELEKTKEERDFFKHECEKISAELLLVKEQFSLEKEGRMRIEEELNEKVTRDSNNKQLHAEFFAGDVNQFHNLGEALTKEMGGPTLPEVESSSSQVAMEPSIELSEQQISTAFSAFEALRGHSSELDMMLLKLENAVEGMHSYSTYSDTGTRPGISKLIQVFESKGHQSEQNQGAESFVEDKSDVDPYMSSREHIRNLKVMGKQLMLDVEHTTQLFSEELKHRRTTDAKVGQLETQSQIFKERVESVVVQCIELGVSYEVMKQHLHDCEDERSQLETFLENMKRQDVTLRAENNQLILKLEDSESRVKSLQHQLNDLQYNSGQFASFSSGQLETLQREATESAVMSQLRWMVIAAEVFESVGKLDAYTSNISAGTFDEVDFGSHVVSSIESVIEVIEDLQEKLKSVDKDQKALDGLCQDVNEKLLISQGKSDLAVRTLHSIYDVLREVGLPSSGSLEQHAAQREENLPDTLNESDYPRLLERLRSILAEKQQIESEVTALQSKLADTMRDVQELEAKCIDVDTVHRLIAAVGGVLKLEAADCNLNGHPLSHLESLIYALVQRCEEANKLADISGENFSSSEIKKEVQEMSNPSSSLNLQLEGEALTLRERLNHAEEALMATQAELREKAAELEQSEKRVSSVREKLSVAIAKGKGLVAQRDHQKQKLADTSSELEKCSKELQLKEARLHEIEAELVAYSEVGERAEALESELSYIRNSATALRESFLLKDSLLQRIEEILEDLDLPEHFHFKDIIEKVEWLARSVAGNALPHADLDQKSSPGGPYSGSGFVVTDPWREDMQPGSNPSDDLRRKYDELQGKFYGLAEQNEMLEQSLMERNDLMQRCEKLLDKIDVPVHVRFVEPEEKIEWLANALSEAHHDKISLQQKIDEIETLCGSVTSDLEDSQQRTSSLQKEIDILGQEREHLTQRLEMLIKNDEELSQKMLHFEDEKEKLLSERSQLHEELARREHLTQRLEMLIKNNEELSQKILHFEDEKEKLLSERNQLREELARREHLTQRLEMVIENNEELSQKILHFEDEKEKLLSERNQLHEELARREHLTQRLEMVIENNEDLSQKILHFEDEKEKLLSERSQLHEELARMVENERISQKIELEIQKLQDMVSQVLLGEVEDTISSGGSSTEILSALLKKLIEKYAAVSSDPSVLDEGTPLNQIADAACPELMTRETVDREVHDQEIVVLKNKLEEALADLMAVKEQREEFLEKNNSLIDLVGTLETKRDELQSLLEMEEQKCASVREKLKVAVWKGKSLVQHRDALKSTIEELNAEIDRKKSEVSNKEDALMRCEQRLQELSSYPERVRVLESEVSYLRNQLSEKESYWQEKEHMMGLILGYIANIDVGGQVDSDDPVQRLEQIQKTCSDLRVAVASLEQESKKSRRAAELLLAELNEVQDRNDSLQEQVAEAASEIFRLSEEKDAAILKCNNLASHHSEERRSISSELKKFKSAAEQLRKVFSDFGSSLTDVLSQDKEIFKMIESAIELSLQQNEAGNDGTRLTISSLFGGLNFRKIHHENLPYSEIDCKMLEQLDGDLLKDCNFVGNQLQDFFVGFGVLKEDLQKHSAHLQEQAASLSETLGAVQQGLVSRKELSEATERDKEHLLSAQKEEIVSLRRNIALLHEACSASLMEIENCNAVLIGNKLHMIDQRVDQNSVTFITKGGAADNHATLTSEESVRSFAERMTSAVKTLIHAKADMREDTQQELKKRVADLQKELQEKDVQKDRICTELVAQIKAAEATATGYSLDLQSAKALVHDLEKQVKSEEHQRSLLEKKVQKMQDGELAAQELQEKLTQLNGTLASKDQEIEALMQALDEEEFQMDDLTKKIEEMERVMQQKDLAVEDLEVSKGKALKKLSVTMSKFHELHHFSTGLLAEVEKLQIQLKEKDAEISFLRQEVTRCTNDALVATQLSNKSGELSEFLAWFDSIISRVASCELDYEKPDKLQDYKESLQKRLASVVSELEDLRVLAEDKDTLLQAERSKIEELKQKELMLEGSLREKESQLSLLQGSEDSGHMSGLTSEIVEIEPVINKRAVSASTSHQVRSLRKPNNEQVAIAIDVDPGSSARLEDEEDDKVHGFKSLATSRVVPKFTRRVTDMVDGLWVSCDRTLMRQPVLRLGIIMYWAVLHALLASFIV